MHHPDGTTTRSNGLYSSRVRRPKRLRLTEFDFDVVYRPGVKHSVETAKQDQGEIDDQIPCVSVGSLEFDDWGTIRDDWLDPTTGEVDCKVFSVAPQLGSEPNYPEKWVREQSLKPLSRQITAELEGGHISRFAVREDGVIVRIAPLDESDQIVVPSALRVGFSK